LGAYWSRCCEWCCYRLCCAWKVCVRVLCLLVSCYMTCCCCCWLGLGFGLVSIYVILKPSGAAGSLLEPLLRVVLLQAVLCMEGGCVRVHHSTSLLQLHVASQQQCAGSAAASGAAAKVRV
jgi:hypothetical protein